VAGIAALFESMAGSDGAVEAVRGRAGGMLAPEVAARFAAGGGDWLAELTAADLRTTVLECEPRPHVTVAAPRVVGEVFGDLADLKSPYLAGHSRGVAALAVGAATRLRLPEATRVDLELAGLLHDVGRVAISSAIWDKPGPLGPDEWEQVRLHPYHSERILAGSAGLTRIAPLVGRHHERLDGSGYHRGSNAPDQSVAARVLAAADAYRTRIEPRPYRPAMDASRAERSLLIEVRAGELDADAAHAVVDAAGCSPARADRGRAMGLSEREIEVLGLLARGRSNAEIAARLVISRRTAEHHVQHVYAKIGVSSRAAATLYAVEHGMLPEDG
jgi:HD-GYP domain-containing protein (c-di-GMP phosphodiesterase class II)/DNA-binding CsgD family transcriptional regulator